MFSDRLRSIRKQKGYTLEELAELYNSKFTGGLNKGTLSKYENNKQEPMLNVVSNLATLLEVPMDYLIGKTNSINDSNKPPLPQNLMPIPKFKKIPLLGSIACGVPILAEQNIEEFLDVEQNINADFALECKGDSMVNANIKSGDIVFIKEQSSVENGQIAAVCIDDGETEATLKRVYFTKDSITLVAENGKYPPLVFHKEDMNKVRIIGRAVSLLTKI